MPAHRAFIIASLALAASVGTFLGLWMALGWAGVVPDSMHVVLAAHSQLQVYGFVALYTMGVSMMVLPSFLRTTLQPKWLALTSLLLMLGGIVINLQGAGVVGGALQSLSTFAFLLVLRITRKSAPPQGTKSNPLSRGHAIFLATGSLWLMIAPMLALRDPTLAMETVLWGFAGLFIAGIGLRVHPGILGIKGVHGHLLAPSALFWNLGLVLMWTGPAVAWPLTIGLGVALFIWALRPFRRPFISSGGGKWLRYFVRTSYFWLLCAVVLACAMEFGHPELGGATRHMLGSGFVITMMMGMGMRMIPAFETKRLPWKQGPWVIYILISLGTAIRVPAQAVNQLDYLAIGGGLQFLGIITFVFLMLSMFWFGKKVHFEAPATQIFEEKDGPDEKKEEQDATA